MSDDDEIEEEEGEDMGTIILMLGLYLIVLAFFILLNAISESSDVKSDKVADSMAEGFGFQRVGPLNMRDDEEQAETPVFEIVSKEIEDVVDSYLSVKDYKFITNGNKMMLELDTKKIFSPGSIRIRPAMAEFFEDIARIVSTVRKKSTLFTQVVLEQNSTDLGVSRLPLSELSGRRATLFVRALIERDVNPELVSADALYQNVDYSAVRLYFDVVEKDAKPRF